MTRCDSGYTPMTIEYQGHTVRHGWYDAEDGKTFRWGNVWYCHGEKAVQSRWCPHCCERNGWTWRSPNTQYVSA